MGRHPRLPWPRTVEEARAEQERLRKLVDTSALRRVPIRSVIGVDVAYSKTSNLGAAAAVVLEIERLEVLEVATAFYEVDFPYVPGFLAFRELPGLLAALAKLHRQPELLICDGHGLTHPRRFGLACHLGVTTGLPTIGVAKTRYQGVFTEPGPSRGDWSPLVTEGRQLAGYCAPRPA
jgi:deoxyribonuclease V